MKKKQQKVAIFDVDGTIFRSSLLIQVVNRLIEVEAFPKEAKKIYEREHERWLDREGDYQEYIDAVVHTFLKNLNSFSCSYPSFRTLFTIVSYFFMISVLSTKSISIEPQCGWNLFEIKYGAHPPARTIYS